MLCEACDVVDGLSGIIIFPRQPAICFNEWPRGAVDTWTADTDQNKSFLHHLGSCTGNYRMQREH